MPGCPLGWSAGVALGPGSDRISSFFFRENRELTWFLEDFRRYARGFRRFKKPRKAAIFFRIGRDFGWKRPESVNFTDSRIGRRVRLLFSVPIIRALFCEVMDLEAHSGAGIGHFVGPVAFTISRLLCCFACSLSLICRGNQPGIASSRPLSGRHVARL